MSYGRYRNRRRRSRRGDGTAKAIIGVGRAGYKAAKFGYGVAKFGYTIAKTAWAARPRRRG